MLAQELQKKKKTGTLSGNSLESAVKYVTVYIRDVVMRPFSSRSRAIACR